MAQQNTKTPAMVLQEFTVKMNCSPPEYNLVRSKSGTHENEFLYEVNVANVIGTGFGRSKQVAKHNAASSALEILADRGLYDPKTNPAQEFNAQSHRNESDSPLRPPVNYIGTLKDLCTDHKLPYPQFVEISDVGPPHCREFTYECQMDSITTQSTANTKKQAKQLAARDMLDKIKDICPELAEKYEAEANALTDKDHEAIVKFNELTEDFDIVPNRAAKVEEFTLTFKKIMDEKGFTFEDFLEQFTSRSKEDFDRIFEKLEIRHELCDLEQTPCVVALKFGVDTPFAIIATGKDKEEAERNVISQAFFVLEIYMNV